LALAAFFKRMLKPALRCHPKEMSRRKSVGRRVVTHSSFMSLSGDDHAEKAMWQNSLVEAAKQVIAALIPKTMA
jgi:hypothetical protein